MDKTPLTAHPYADLFPLMTAEELDALAADIRANGLRKPIVLLEGKILDGRNRYKACLIAGVEPRFEDYTGDDPLGYVNSENIARRHLTPGQRAMIAAKEWVQHGDTKKRGRPA